MTCALSSSDAPSTSANLSLIEFTSFSNPCWLGTATVLGSSMSDTKILPLIVSSMVWLSNLRCSFLDVASSDSAMISDELTILTQPLRC